MLCSCLIARNLLSGLRTCIEVSSYMHDGGASMLHKSLVVPNSIMEDNGKADMEFTVSIPILFSFWFFVAPLRFKPGCGITTLLVERRGCSSPFISSLFCKCILIDWWEIRYNGYPTDGHRLWVTHVSSTFLNFLSTKGWLCTTVSLHLWRFNHLN